MKTKQENRRRMTLSFLSTTNPVSCSTSVFDDGVVLIGTERGTLMAFEACGPSSKPHTSLASSARFRLVASHATHARTIRSVAVCGVSWLVATASDDATVVLQTLASLLCGGKQTSTSLSRTTLASDLASPLVSSTYPLRLRGLHTLPISHAEWVAGRAELITSSFDGYLAVYCASTHAVVNRVHVGFPLSTFCLCPTDVGVVFAAGRGMARVDLLEGARIPAHGALSTQLLFTNRHTAPELTPSTSQTAVLGVERMQWLADEDDTTTHDDVHDEDWATDTTHASNVTYHSGQHTVSMFAPCQEGGMKVLTWKLKSSRWRVAGAPQRASLEASRVHYVQQLLQVAHIENIDPQAHQCRSSSQLNTTPPPWSLGFATWHRPEAAAQTIVNEIRVLPTPSCRDADIVAIVDRKRLRQEAEESPQLRELTALQAALQAAQHECDALAATLKEFLSKR
jgi:hypothetical protein